MPPARILWISDCEDPASLAQDFAAGAYKTHFIFERSALSRIAESGVPSTHHDAYLID